MCTLIVGRHFEGAPGAGRGLLEDQGDIETLQTGDFPTLSLGSLELCREVQQVANLRRGEVDQGQEAAASQVNAHGIKVSELVGCGRTGFGAARNSFESRVGFWHPEVSRATGWPL
jgi:hypothetical protein